MTMRRWHIRLTDTDGRLLGSIGPFWTKAGARIHQRWLVKVMADKQIVVRLVKHRAH